MRGIAFLALAGCALSFSKTSGNVTCLVDADCPKPGICALAKQRCVSARDHDAPRMLSAKAIGPQSISVTFSEPLFEDSGIEQCLIEPALTVVGTSRRDDGATVELSTAERQARATSYRVTCATVQDDAGNVVANEAKSATFQSFLGPPSGVIPVAIAPLDFAVARGLSVLLSWQAVSDAFDYSVDVASDAAFANLVIPGRIVPAPTTNVALTLPDSRSYYWRVRADSSAPDGYGRGSFDTLGGTIFVYCASTDACGAGGGVETGSLSHPMRSVQRGVIQAQEVGAGVVAVAARGGSGYLEPILIEKTAVQVRGGYDPSFTIQDPDQYETVLTAADSVVRLTDVAGGGLDGLTLRGLPSADPMVIDARRVRDVVFSHLKIDASGDVFTATAVSVDNRSTDAPTQITISDCDIEVAAPNAPRGIMLSYAVPVIRNTHIQTAAPLDSISLGDTSYGIYVQFTGNVAGEISDSSVTMAAGTRAAYGIFIDDYKPPTAAIGLMRNLVKVPDHTGVYISAPAVLDRNDIATASTGDVAAVVVFGARATLTNNIISSAQAAVNAEYSGALTMAGNTLVAMTPYTGDALGPVTNNLFVGSTGAPCVDASRFSYRQQTSFENNAFVGCSTLFQVGATGLTSADAVNALNGTPNAAPSCGTSTTSPCHQMRFANNVATAQTAAQVFVAPTTRDFHLLLATDPAAIRTAGKDATGMTCGPITQATACGGTTENFAGATRAAPFSIGAY